MHFELTFIPICPKFFSMKIRKMTASRTSGRGLDPDWAPGSKTAKIPAEFDLDGFNLLLKYRRQLVQEKRENRLHAA